MLTKDAWACWTWKVIWTTNPCNPLCTVLTKDFCYAFASATKNCYIANMQHFKILRNWPWISCSLHFKAFFEISVLYIYFHIWNFLMGRILWGCSSFYYKTIFVGNCFWRNLFSPSDVHLGVAPFFLKQYFFMFPPQKCSHPDIMKN